jgi:DNA-directed RNA polymerase subunit RPC12/RpoP
MSANYPYLSNKLCPICGQRILIERSRDVKKKFCSLPCYYRNKSEDPSQKWVRREILERECLWCGEKFSTDQNKMYCSKSCAKKKFK